MAELAHPPVEELELPAVLFALSDSARLAIVRQIATPGVEATCHSEEVDMAKSTAQPSSWSGS